MFPHAAWPVDPNLLGAFVVAALVIELTPGPNMAWLALVAAEQGRATAFAAVAGVTLGLGFYAAAGVAGAAQAVLQAPALYQALRWAGVGYLLWLAWAAWRAAPVAQASVRAGSAFRRGLIANLLNPKAALFYLTVTPAFVRPDHGDAARQLLALGVIHLTIATAVHLAIVTAAARFAGRLARTGLLDRRVGAGLLVAVAVWTAWASRH
jgi:threonine/homoserine/homoserine lactone efflux protein